MSETKIICTQCGTVIKSLAQAQEECEEKPYTKGPHSIRGLGRAVLAARETRKKAGAKRTRTA